MNLSKILVLCAPLALGVSAGGSSLAIGAAVAGCASVTPTLVVGGITLGAQAVICAAQTVGADTSTNPPAPPLQIALDLAKNCGMDVEQIVALFGATHPVAQAATQNAAAVHAAALAHQTNTSTATPSASEANAQWQQARALMRAKYGWE
jgi:hypothetical protein